MIEWKPEQAPQAIVMNSMGKMAGVAALNPTRSLPVQAG